MSREILFRGKQIDNGDWVQGYLFRIWERAYICWGTVNEVPDMTEVDPETVCQYTGVTDENGRKIFEGDIVTINGENEHFAVKWDDDTARFVMRSGTLVVDFDNYWGREVEVIGNMHDNPEFLKNKIDVKELRELSDAYTACGHSDAGRKFRQAANTIEDLSVKLAAANMEQAAGRKEKPCHGRLLRIPGNIPE